MINARKAMVLAAGVGKRLMPLTKLVPKPLVPVLNRPLINYPLSLLVNAGVKEVAVNLHHLGDLIEQELAKDDPGNMKIRYSYEKEILGTGGGLAQHASFLSDSTFYLLNGDILCDVDLLDVFDFHKKMEATATMVVRPYPAGADFTPLEMDEAGFLTSFKEAKRKPKGKTCPVMFCGVHVLEPSIFDFIPTRGFFCINTQAYTKMINDGHNVAAYLYQGPWYDVGTHQSYLDANLDLVSGRSEISTLKNFVEGLSGKSVLLGENSDVPEGTVVGPEVVIGSGVTIGKGSTIHHSVAWDNTTIPPNSRLQNAILAGQHIIQL